MEKQEYAFKNKITILTLIMTVFVVLSHWGGFYSWAASGGGVGFASWVTSLFSLLGYSALVLFFMMSGFLFFRGVKDVADLKGKLLRRAVYLGIPFIFWNVFSLIYNIAYGLYKGALNISLLDILKGFTVTPFNSPMWYLLALLVLMCISPLMLLLKRAPRLSLIVVVLIFVFTPFLCASLSPSGSILLWSRRLLGYFPAYLLGAVLAMHKDEKIVKGEYKYHRLVFGGSLLLLVAIILIFTLGNIRSSALKILTYQTIPILIWLALPANALKDIKMGAHLCAAPILYATHSVLILVLNWLFTRVILAGVNLPIAVDFLLQLVLVGLMYVISFGILLLAKMVLPEKIFRIFAGGSAGRKML